MKTKTDKKQPSLKQKVKYKNLKLTDAQYRRLLHLMALGYRTVIEDFEEDGISLADIENYINSFSEKFNSTDLVYYNTKYEMYLHSDTLKNNTNKIIDYYDELVFLMQVSEKLTIRDIELTGKTKEEIDIEDFEKMEQQYFTELEVNGVKNLKLIKK